MLGPLVVGVCTAMTPAALVAGVWYVEAQDEVWVLPQAQGQLSKLRIVGLVDAEPHVVGQLGDLVAVAHGFDDDPRDATAGAAHEPVLRLCRARLEDDDGLTLLQRSAVLAAAGR